MSSLILPSRLTRQPQGPARLARRWASFAGATIFNAGRDIATGARLSSVQTALPAGIGATVVLGSAQAIPLGLAVTASWSLLIVLRRDAEISYPYFLGVLNGGTYKYALAGKNDTIGQRMGWYDGTSFRDSGFSQPLGSTDTIGLTYDGTTNRYSWYKNGRAYNSDIGASNGSGTWQLASIAGEGNTNTFALFSIVPRTVPAADMLALTAQPWALLDTGSSSAYMAALASAAPSAPVGNAYTMPAAQGSYTITGNAASLRAARRLTASAGAYAIAGNAAALRVSRRMAAVAGAYSITGSAAGLIKSTAPRALQVAAGSYVITGNAATLRAARRLQAAPGAYAITGFAVADRVIPTVTISVRFDTLPRDFRTKTIHFSN